MRRAGRVDRPTDDGGKRLTILDAAARVFERHGLHAAKIEDIAAEAGIGKGTIYLYFSSKEELIQEMVRFGLESYLEGIRSIAREGRGAADTLRRIAEFTLEGARAHQGAAQLVMLSSSGLRPEVRRWLLDVREEIRDVYRAVIGRGIGDGELRDSEPEVLTHIYGGALVSMVTTEFYGRRGEPAAPAPATPAGMARRLVEVFMGGAAHPRGVRAGFSRRGSE